jgi:hypothetical protein
MSKEHKIIEEGINNFISTDKAREQREKEGLKPSFIDHVFDADKKHREALSEFKKELDDHEKRGVKHPQHNAIKRSMNHHTEAIYKLRDYLKHELGDNYKAP